MIEYLLMTCKEQVFAYYISSQAPVFFLLPSSYATKSFSLLSNCFYLIFENYPPIPQVFNCYIFFVPFTFCISPFKPTKNAPTIRANLTYMMRYQFIVSSGTTRGTTSH